jgi:hypothetical protein
VNDRLKQSEDERDPRELAANDEDRYAIDPRTGFEYVKRRPGQRMVTSEEILKELEDFP